MKRLILASASPRRAQLLKQINQSFKIVKSDYIEPPLSDEKELETVALAKARSVHKYYPGDLILGADTVVVLGTKILGKPRSEAEALAMLQALSGQTHRVLSGIALLQENQVLTAKEETRVWMRSFTETEIHAYIATGESVDKAGSYGIQGQGAVFVERIEGCYFNVVGLPLARLALMFREMGWPLWQKGGD